MTIRLDFLNLACIVGPSQTMHQLLYNPCYPRLEAPSVVFSGHFLTIASTILLSFYNTSTVTIGRWACIQPINRIVPIYCYSSSCHTNNTQEFHSHIRWTETEGIMEGLGVGLPKVKRKLKDDWYICTFSTHVVCVITVPPAVVYIHCDTIKWTSLIHQNQATAYTYMQYTLKYSQ